MITQQLGQTDLYVSRLGFGCGSMGGLLVRGDYPTMRQVVARAIDLGITYFDTAPLYGNGQSEVNLGAVLRELQADVVVGTKVRLTTEEMDDIEAAVFRSVEASLRRLGRNSIDLLQLHNRFGPDTVPERRTLDVPDLAVVAGAFAALQQQGKIRAWGLTGLGTTEAIQAAIASRAFQSIQVPYNLLNPSAGMAVSDSFPFQDYGQAIDRAAQHGMGVIAIRILAGGALAGTPERHPIAAKTVDPIASSPDYQADVARARRFGFLMDEGIVENLVEAAIRFVVSQPYVSTALLGISSGEQLEAAVRYVERGPLPANALARIGEMQTA